LVPPVGLEPTLGGF